MPLTQIFHDMKTKLLRQKMHVDSKSEHSLTIKDILTLENNLTMNLARSRIWTALAQDCRLARRPVRPQARRQLSSSVEPNIIKSPFHDVTLPTCTVPELIWEQLDRWADKTAVECGINGKSYTYAELKLLSRRLAFALLKSGLHPGDVVTIVMPNIPEYLVAMLGTMEAGMVVTGINPIYASGKRSLHTVLL
ncbi:hypothetical protein GE061_008783 [Apolygus lucorum]|uniref:AMP-dependent synthetase/ligase domain-containing protein n=1 Tax=Apolygus lucorum TaxID=248454 RepID=A0A8S9WPS5_APOLU|nr:hypothetical protein GE061_008783 [Apolygus lucorum]